jgi:hypothetical protein
VEKIKNIIFQRMEFIGRRKILNGNDILNGFIKIGSQVISVNLVTQGASNDWFAGLSTYNGAVNPDIFLILK